MLHFAWIALTAFVFQFSRRIFALKAAVTELYASNEARNSFKRWKSGERSRLSTWVSHVEFVRTMENIFVPLSTVIESILLGQNVVIATNGHRNRFELNSVLRVYLSPIFRVKTVCCIYRQWKMGTENMESKKETRNRMLGVLLSKSFGNNS